MVDLNSEQTISGTKAYKNTIVHQSSSIDLTQTPTAYTSNNFIKAVDKNGLVSGWVEHDVTPALGGSVETSIVSSNKDGYQTSIRCVTPYEGNSGAFGVAPITPAGAQDNAIITKRSITSGSYSRPITFQVDTIIDNANPEANTSAEVVFVAGTSNVNNYCGSMGITRTTDGESRAYIRTGTAASGEFKGDYLTLKTTANGVSWAEAPTHSIDLSGNKITTIVYIDTKFQVVSALPASPNANVFYFIPE